MKEVVRWCAGRPVGVLMVIVAVCVGGAVAGANLPLGRLPEIAVPRVVVEAGMPGLPAMEIRSLVAAPLEDALASAKGLVRSSSVSRDDAAMLVLDFRWGEDTARAAGRVREIVDAAWQSLPEGADKPVVMHYDPEAEPLVIVTVTPRDGDLASARRIAEYVVRARLRRVDGAGSVVVVGGLVREAAVAVDMGKAAVMGLTVVDVARAVAAESADVPAGSLREGDLELVAVARGRPSGIRGLSMLVVPGPSGPFRLSDLATVDERDAPRKSVFVADGDERVALEVFCRPGADPVATAGEARSAIDGLSGELGPDMRLDIVRDSSTAIAGSIRNLAIAGAIGAAVVVLVLLVMLRDLKAGIIVASSIPVSVAATLAVLSALGRSLNGMSLGGISLAIGMISDNAVVVLDSLSSGFSTYRVRPGPREISDAVGAALSGTFGSMATTAVVFVPVFFLPGAIGGLFGDLAVSIIAANIAGWLTAVLALPAAWRVAWTPAKRHAGRSLERVYRKALALSLHRPVFALSAAALAAAGGAALVSTRPVSFMPPDAAVEMTVTAGFPPGSDPDGMARMARSLTAALAAVPGLAGAYGSAGSEDDDAARRADPAFLRETLTVTCPLARGADPLDIGPALLAAAKRAVPGQVALSVSVPPDPAAVLLGLDRGMVVAIKAGTVEAARSRADDFEEALRVEARASLLSSSRTPSGRKARIVMRPDPGRSAAFGLTLSEAATVVRAATSGVEAATLESDGRRTTVRVFASGAGLADGGGSMMSARSVAIFAGDGSVVDAGSMARFDRSFDESALARLDRSDVILVAATAAPGRERDLNAAIDRVVPEIAGAERSDESAFRRYGEAMAKAVLLVLALLYLTLGAQFESFTMPLVVMATIPLAMAGVGPAMIISGTGLDSGSVLGLVVLFGVAVNNAILLHEAGSAIAAAGAGPAAAAYAGASGRVRPVLATTLTTVVALLPVCLSPTGAAQRSMSVALLGGLVASTALTLFVSPVAFAAMGRFRVAGRAGLARTGLTRAGAGRSAGGRP